MIRHIDMQLLREAILKQQPELLPLLNSLGYIPLAIEQRESIREAIAMELSETGLDEADEPNERGIRLEQIISYLGRI